MCLCRWLSEHFRLKQPITFMSYFVRTPLTKLSFQFHSVRLKGKGQHCLYDIINDIHTVHLECCISWHLTYTCVCSYNVICIELESLYPQHNMVQWWGALNTSIKILKGKRLPMTDIELHEQFKKTFGCTKAIKCKVITDNQLII